MSKNSQLLENNKDAVVALLKYVKQQSNMTFLQLEQKFERRKLNKKIREVGANNGGTSWWRWEHGYHIPGIDVLRTLFKYSSDQLIEGKWKLNGKESNWVKLLPAVVDPKFSFVTERNSAFIEILNQLHESQLMQPAHPLVTENILQAVKLGYYLPSEAEIRSIFWAAPNQHDNIYKSHAYVPWYSIWPNNDAQRNEMEMLITDLLSNFGMSKTSRNALNDFAGACNLTGESLESWTDQIENRIMLDMQLLNEISARTKYLFPMEFKNTNADDDDSIKSSVHEFHKMSDELAMAARKFEQYYEDLNTKSRTSKMYGLMNKLSYSHFMSSTGGFGNRINWDYPTIDIL